MTTGSVVAWIEGRAKELAARARRFGGDGVNGKIDVLASTATHALADLVTLEEQMDALDVRINEVLQAFSVAAVEGGTPSAEQGPPSPSMWSAQQAAEPHAKRRLPLQRYTEPRRLTKQARATAYRRVVAALAQGEEALRAEHEVLKSELGPRAYRTLGSLIANARRHTGKRGAAAGSVADASPQPKQRRKRERT